MNLFFNSPWVQLVSLAVMIATFAWAPSRMRKVSEQVNASHLHTFTKLWKDVYVQCALSALLPLTGFGLLVGLNKQSLPEGICNAYFGMSLATGAFALWNIRKAHVASQVALASPQKGWRTSPLAQISEKNIRAFTAGLVSIILGILGLLMIQISFQELPSWFWLLAFLLSGLAINALGWSISLSFAADIYERDPKHAARRK